MLLHVLISKQNGGKNSSRLHFLLSHKDRRNQAGYPNLYPSSPWIGQMDSAFATPLKKSQSFQNKTWGKGSTLFPLCICNLRVFHKVQLWSNSCTRKEYSPQHVFTLKSEPKFQGSTVLKKKTKKKPSVKWPESCSFPSFLLLYVASLPQCCSSKQTRQQCWEHSFAVIFKCHSADFILLLLLFSNRC